MGKLQKQFIAMISLTVFADILFYEHIIGGISLALFYLAILVCIAFCEEKFLHNKWLIAVSMSLIIGNIYYTNFWSVFLSILSLCSIMIVVNHGWLTNAFDWIREWFLSVFFFLFCFIDDMPVVINTIRQMREKNIMGWMIALFLSSVFIILFSIANPIIEVWISYITTLHLFPFERFIFWCFFALISWSFLRLSKPRLLDTLPQEEQESPKVDEQQPQQTTPMFEIFTPQTTIICLRMFNLVFVIQTALDIIYLWAGGDLPQGMSYAEYAHRGAYPLVFTALLAAGFVLVTFNDQSKNIRTARFWVYMWLAQNVFLMISSVLRLNLYIEVYHLTRWRVAAIIWMGLVALGLVLILIRIVKNYPNTWLVNANLIALLGVFYVCAFFNIDGYIANYNVANTENTHIALDIKYLENLGIESLPALRKLQRKSNRNGLDSIIRRLERKLERQMNNWRGWSYYHYLIQQQPK